MLKFHAPGRPEMELQLSAKTIPAEVNWIDVLKPEAQEIAFLKQTLGIELPTLEELAQIERSSRLRSEENWVRFSVPVIYQTDGFLPALTPVGIVLSTNLLLTVRFERFKTFDNVLNNFAYFPAQTSGIGALIVIIEAVIDHIADLLERVGSDLDRLSEEILIASTRAAARCGRTQADYASSYAKLDAKAI